MKKLLLLIIFLSCWTLLPAQLSYGTTGLLHAPSADMQKDKTVMLGGNFLHQELTPPKFNFNTWNYYLNVTIFPFLEVAYTCTLFTAESLGLDKHGYSGFTNQDRYFSARLRVLKESKYIPAVVLGTSDPFTSSGHKFASAIGNGYFCRYYLAATKHFQLGRETLGVHLSYLYNRREDYPFERCSGRYHLQSFIRPAFERHSRIRFERLRYGSHLPTIQSYTFSIWIAANEIFLRWTVL